jgi:hypothetical protein
MAAGSSLGRCPTRGRSSRTSEPPSGRSSRAAFCPRLGPGRCGPQTNREPRKQNRRCDADGEGQRFPRETPTPPSFATNNPTNAATHTSKHATLARRTSRITKPSTNATGRRMSAMYSSRRDSGANAASRRPSGLPRSVARRWGGQAGGRQAVGAITISPTPQNRSGIRHRYRDSNPGFRTENPAS